MQRDVYGAREGDCSEVVAGVVGLPRNGDERNAMSDEDLRLLDRDFWEQALAQPMQELQELGRVGHLRSQSLLRGQQLHATQSDDAERGRNVLPADGMIPDYGCTGQWLDRAMHASASPRRGASEAAPEHTMEFDGDLAFVEKSMANCPLPEVRSAAQELLYALQEAHIRPSKFFSQRAGKQLEWIQEVGGNKSVSESDSVTTVVGSMVEKGVSAPGNVGSLDESLNCESLGRVTSGSSSVFGETQTTPLQAVAERDSANIPATGTNTFHFVDIIKWSQDVTAKLGPTSVPTSWVSSSASAEPASYGMSSGILGSTSMAVNSVVQNGARGNTQFPAACFVGSSSGAVGVLPYESLGFRGYPQVVQVETSQNACQIPACSFMQDAGVGQYGSEAALENRRWVLEMAPLPGSSCGDLEDYQLLDHGLGDDGESTAMRVAVESWLSEPSGREHMGQRSSGD